MKICRQIWCGEQLAANKAPHSKYKAKKFIPYLQNFVFYLPPEQLRTYVEEACAAEDIVAVYIATRPDCISDEYLALLADIRDRYGVDICGARTAERQLSFSAENQPWAYARGFLDAVLRIGHTDCSPVLI